MTLSRLSKITFLLFLVCFMGLQAQKIANKKAPKTLIEITEGLQKEAGLIDSYFAVGGKLFFGISEDILNKDLLMVTRIVRIPANYSAYSNAGSKTSEQLVHFEKRGQKIVLTQVSYNALAQESDPINLSVVQNNNHPILAAFEIEAQEEGQYLIEVTDYFSDDSPGFNIVGSRQKEAYKMGGVDKKRSSIDRVRSFPINTEVTHTLTYSARKAPRGNNTETLSFVVNHSLILLPEDPMPVRYEDRRVGWFSMDKIDYSSEALKADAYSIVRRWRLEPSDEAAYSRGELVVPKKQIVYYLDPATPLKWRPYFRKGIEDWNSAFEKAGFKNAIVAKDAPTPEEDPDFSPEDARYSMVRYVASTTRNATGPSVSDPRTGEIIESDIIWYHNHLRSYRNRYLLETAAANPKARTLDTPEEEIGEMMRRVISHEIGHALGLPHNMKASSAYPVDSLRSGTFTQKMGIATTIMDYARYNYIAQPGDKNIRFVRQLGPYDNYAIEWGYRYFPGQDPLAVKESLRQWVDARSTDPIYMFGSGGSDPNSQTENIGDNPIKASTYGLSNLRIVGKNLNQWAQFPNSTYDDLAELHGEFLGVFRRYVYHVAKLVGGVNETRLNNNQAGTPYVNVTAGTQLEALDFLSAEVWNAPTWLIPKDLVSRFSSDGALDALSKMQMDLLKSLLAPKKLTAMLSAHYTLEGNGLALPELFNRLSSDIVLDKAPQSVLDRKLQKAYLHILIDLKGNEDTDAEVKGMVIAQLEVLKDRFKKFSKSSNPLVAAHGAYGLVVIKD